VLIRKDTNKEFQFRIRNLNYDKSNFIVECDKTKQEIVVKTVNKKYYKRIEIPDLKRAHCELDESNLKVNFLNNTLIISVTIHHF
jgi:protein DPCD